ncbi:MAG: hypothetical protein LAO30_22555 [Acidobacteriia bacterium]|nr:hypothetical protein [Terriglobia bacterium]
MFSENKRSNNAIADFVHGTRKITGEDLRQMAYFSKVNKAIRVRLEYKETWPWGAAAEYLYRALIQALGLGEEEEELLLLAKSKPGRKEERELAGRILCLKAKGMTVPQIKKAFEKENQYYSLEKIESYLKTRRKHRRP